MKKAYQITAPILFPGSTLAYLVPNLSGITINGTS
jgi:hypothetical protein